MIAKNMEAEPIKAYNIYAAKYMFWRQLEEYREEKFPEEKVPFATTTAKKDLEKEEDSDSFLNPFILN